MQEIDTRIARWLPYTHQKVRNKKWRLINLPTRAFRHFVTMKIITMQNSILKDGMMLWILYFQKQKGNERLNLKKRISALLKQKARNKMGKKSFEEIKDRFSKYGKFREEGEVNE